MTENHASLAHFYEGWDVYQQQITGAIAPLTPEQLALRAVPHLRSIGEIATHMIAVRARWFHSLMGEGGTDMSPIEAWDRKDTPARSAAELVQGFEVTWLVIQEALARWVPADLEYVFSGTRGEEHYAFSRQWVIWHVIEHDLHHGGELSFSLGMHGLTAIDI